jgi:membrane fusion protein (multidrug efflux system)
MADPTPAASPAQSGPNPRRRQQLTWLAAAVAAGLVIYFIYWLLVASHYVATDNAYVGADSALVSPLISGPVSQVLVAETQIVKAGQPLVVLDPSDTQIAVAEARANLGQAERKVRGYFANNTTLTDQMAGRAAEIAHAQAMVASAQSDMERARAELARREALKGSGAISADELTDAQNRFATAQAALTAAQATRTQAVAARGAAEGSRESNAALIAGAAINDNPEVAAARARLLAAELALSRTILRAPIDGVISKKSVQIGQQVQVGVPLMEIVPIRSVYVDANFKEVQLKKVAVGQPVILTSDLYGGGVKFHGHVAGLSGGTGSAFSLIPAQNASGNWIKIVQRLPVRITLDPDDLAHHPLRIGLSMKATINTARQDR